MRFQDEAPVTARYLPRSFVDAYDRYYEDSPTGPDENLQLIVNVIFQPVTTSEDPKIIKVTVEGPGYDVTDKISPRYMDWLVKAARSVQGLPRRNGQVGA